MLSKEHTEGGHSEFQDAILKKLDKAGYAVHPVFTDHGFITVVSDGIYSISYLMTRISGDDDFCEKMNEFLGKAYKLFFGAEFDESVE